MFISVMPVLEPSYFIMQYLANDMMNRPRSLRIPNRELGTEFRVCSRPLRLARGNIHTPSEEDAATGNYTQQKLHMFSLSLAVYFLNTFLATSMSLRNCFSARFFRSACNPSSPPNRSRARLRISFLEYNLRGAHFL